MRSWLILLNIASYFTLGTRPRKNSSKRKSWVNCIVRSWILDDHTKYWTLLTTWNFSSMRSSETCPSTCKIDCDVNYAKLELHGHQIQLERACGDENETKFRIYSRIGPWFSMLTKPMSLLRLFYLRPSYMVNSSWFLPARCIAPDHRYTKKASKIYGFES